MVLSDLLACLRNYPSAQQVIHGHTHLPSIQLIRKSDNTWIKCWVLSDWNAKQGNMLVAHANQTNDLIYFS